MRQMNPNDLSWLSSICEFGDPTVDGVGEGVEGVWCVLPAMNSV